MCMFWDNMQGLKSKDDRGYGNISKYVLMNDFEQLIRISMDIIHQNQDKAQDYLANLGALLNDCYKGW